MWNTSHPLKHWLTHTHTRSLSRADDQFGYERSTEGPLCSTIEWEMTALAQIFKSFSEDPEKVRAPWTDLRLNNDDIWFHAFFRSRLKSFSGWFDAAIAYLTPHTRSAFLDEKHESTVFVLCKKYVHVCVCVCAEVHVRLLSHASQYREGDNWPSISCGDRLSPARVSEIIEDRVDQMD